MDVVIYHNPACGTSRNTLALIRNAGIEPEMVEYLNTPPSPTKLVKLLADMGMPVRDVLREKGTPYAQMGLSNPALSDDVLLDAIAAHPILINRPIVVTPKGAKLCRPSDVVLDLLPEPPRQNLERDDGTPFLRDEQITAGPELIAAMEGAGLPTDDLMDPGRTFHRYTRLDGEVVGYSGFELYGGDVLLRSMAVTARFHGQGNGRNLALLLMRRAFNLGARQAFVLTSDAAAFFERIGFRRLDRTAAPASILATRQARGVCPASATLLTRRIAP